jgi:hypothetical protein
MAGMLCSSLLEKKQTNDFRDSVASLGLTATLRDQRHQSERHIRGPRGRTKIMAKTGQHALAGRPSIMAPKDSGDGPWPVILMRLVDRPHGQAIRHFLRSPRFATSPRPLWPNQSPNHCDAGNSQLRI